MRQLAFPFRRLPALPEPGKQACPAAARHTDKTKAPKPFSNTDVTMVTATGAPLTGKPEEVALDMSTPALAAAVSAGALQNKAYPVDLQKATQTLGFGINGKTPKEMPERARPQK